MNPISVEITLLPLIYKSVAFVENGSMDQEMCILEMLARSSSMKLIAKLKLAMARINPVHIEGGKADPWDWEFIGNFSPREEESVAGVWVEKKRGLEGSLARQEGQG